MRAKDRQVVGYLLVISAIATLGSAIYAAVLILGGPKWAGRVDVASPWLGCAFAVFVLLGFGPIVGGDQAGSVCTVQSLRTLEAYETRRDGPLPSFFRYSLQWNTVTRRVRVSLMRSASEEID